MAAGSIGSAVPAPDLRMRPGTMVPEGPPFWSRLMRGDMFREDAVTFLRSNARKYGDLVYFRAFGRDVLQFNHPELVGELLVRNEPHNHRNLVMQRSSAVLGAGLLTSEEPLHMRQRKLAAPAFHRERIAAYGEAIAHYTLKMTSGWTDGSTLEIRGEMLLLALRIVGKTLFNTDVEGEVHRIAQAVDSFQGFLPLSFLPFPGGVQKLPLPALRRIKRGREELDSLIFRMIAERHAAPGDRGDLLSMLMSSVEEDGSGMSDRQVRDECLTVLLAGHETTANALTFAVWLLAAHPEIQEELAAECSAVLRGSAPTAADYAQLGLAERVFAEALRLYPPVWVTARTAAEDYTFRGFKVRRGAILVAPQVAVHTDPRFWDEPMRFDPSRFTPERKAQRPRHAYFPFGAGGRQCIGEGLAWMEGVLCLAAMAQQWRFHPAGAGGALKLDPSVSLRPKGPVSVRLERR